MNYGLVGAIGGIGEGIAQNAQMSIANRNRVDLEKEMSEILAQRKQAELDMQKKFQTDTETRQRGLVASDRQDPTNPAYYDLRKKQREDVAGESGRAMQDILTSGEGVLPNGDQIITTNDGQIARLDKDRNAVQMWNNIDDFQKSQMDLGIKAKLGSEEALMKQREAAAKADESRSGLIDAQAKAGGFRPGAKTSAMDAKTQRYLATQYKDLISKEDMAGKTVVDPVAQSALLAAVQLYGEDDGVSMIQQINEASDDPVKRAIGYRALLSQARAGANEPKAAAPKEPAAAEKKAGSGQTQVSPHDIGYSPNDATQFNYVLDNLSDQMLRAQALAWIEGGSLSVGQRKQVERALK